MSKSDNNHHKLLIALCFLVLAAGLALTFAYEPGSVLAPVQDAVAEPKTTTLLFAGDIMLSRNVAARMYAASDFSLPFKNVADRVKDADISFANLESPFNDQGDHSVEGSMVFNADPKSVEGLKSAGFDILSTANNHSFDQGKKGIEYTVSHLKQHGIVPVGTGSDCHNGVIIEKNQIKFGFLAYSYAAYNDGGKIPDLLVCDWNNQAQVTADIANLRSKVDVLIVSIHMGTEYKREPDESNAEGAKNAIGAGADLVIGHHPHWIQTIKEYSMPEVPHQGWVFHSLGNFVFDQMWSTETREGLAVEVLFKDKKLSRINLLPVIIDNYCCPRWSNEQETKAILSKINLTSPILYDNN